MNLGDRELARRVGDKVEVRPHPLRLRVRFDDLPCADSHLLRVHFACSVELADNEIDRRVFAETFLSTRSSVTEKDLVEHFTPALRTALAHNTAQRPAEQWMLASAHEELSRAVRKAAEPLEFDAGLKLLAPFELTCESDSLKREQVEQMQRNLAEKRAAGQLQHVQHSAELLKQFQALRQSAPELSASAILQTLSAADRADMYEALLHAGERENELCLWAVAGNDLLRIEPRTASPKVERIGLDAGPFRSVQADELNGKRVLLLGGRDSVVIFDSADRTPVIRDVALGLTPQLGFNRVVVHNDRVWATHGELGICAWNSDGSPHATLAIGQLPAPTFNRPSSRVSGSIQTIASVQQPAQPAGPRNIAVLDQARLILSVGNRLALIDADTSAVSPIPGEIQADVLAIFPDRERIVIVHDNGTIHLRSAQTLELIEERPRAATLCSTTLLPWLGETRLLLAHADGCIDCIGLDDSVVTEYRSAHREIKDIAASPTTIAAVTGDRSRVILWHAWEGTQPFAQVHVSALTRRRAGDVCFG